MQLFCGVKRTQDPNSSLDSKQAMRTIFKKPSRYSYKPLFKENNILTFPSIYCYGVSVFVYKIFHLFQNVQFSNNSTYYLLKNQHSVRIPTRKTTFLKPTYIITAFLPLPVFQPEALIVERDHFHFRRGVSREKCY